MITSEKEWIKESADYIRQIRARNGDEDQKYVPGQNYDEDQNQFALRQLIGTKGQGGMRARLATLERQTSKLVKWELGHVLSGMDGAVLRELRSHVVKASTAIRRLEQQCMAEKESMPTKCDPRRRNLYLHRSAYRLAYAYCDEHANRKGAGKLAEKILHAAGLHGEHYLASNGTVAKWKRQLEAEFSNRDTKK